jgi:hypothetical protein
MIRKFVIIVFLSILFVFDCFSQDTICYNMENKDYSDISKMDNKNGIPFSKFDSNYSDSKRTEQSSLDEYYYKTQAPATSWFYDRFGINLILSAAKQDITGADIKSSYLYCMGMGVFYEFYKTDFIKTCLNFEYIQRGSETYLYIMDYKMQRFSKVKAFNIIDYISIPIVFKVLLFKGKINPIVFLGVNMDYMISYNSDYLNEYFANANKIIFGGTSGIGFEFKINQYLILLPSINYNFDFNYSINYSKDNDNLKFKNNSFDFRLGIKIQ